MPVWSLVAGEGTRRRKDPGLNGSLRLIARRLGKRGPSVRAFVLQTGGVQRHPPRRPPRCLSMAEREEISRGVAAGEPCRQIAARLGRAPSTVSRELASIHGQVTAHPGVAKYHNTYSPDPANLGRVTQPALLDALQQILAGCQTLLRPGGLLC